MSSPLITAAENADVEELRKCLITGGNPNAQNIHGNPLIHIILSSGKDEDQINACLNVLIEEYAADVNVPNTEGHTLLHLAVDKYSSDYTEYLLSKGAKVNIKDKQGNTPLHLAVAHFGCSSVVELLLNAIDNPFELENFINETNNLGNTALHILLEKNPSLQNPVFKFLVEKGADQYKENHKGITPFHFMVQQELICGASSLNKEQVQQALTKGANPDAYPDDGKYAIHIVLSTLHKEEEKIKIEQKIIEILNLLKKVKANINIQDVLSRTALHWAVQMRYVAVVDWLLNNDAEIEAKECANMTPLHLAAEFHDDGLEVMKLLLIRLPVEKRIPAVNAVDLMGNTPLILAVQALRGTRNPDLSVIRFLLENKSEINKKNKQEKTALHYAAEFENCELVELLIQNGADVNALDKKNRIPAEIAAMKSNIKTCESLQTGVNESVRIRVKKLQQEQKELKTHPALEFSSILGSSPTTVLPESKEEESHDQLMP